MGEIIFGLSAVNKFTRKKIWTDVFLAIFILLLTNNGNGKGIHKSFFIFGIILDADHLISFKKSLIKMLSLGLVEDIRKSLRNSRWVTIGQRSGEKHFDNIVRYTLGN